MKKYQKLAFCGLFRWLKSKVSPAQFACLVRHFEHWFQSSRFQRHVTCIFFRVLKKNGNVFFQQKCCYLFIPGQLYDNPGWKLIIPGILIKAVVLIKGS